MSFSEFDFNFTKEYYLLKKLYENINQKNNSNFNDHDGDITEGIKWIWANNISTLNFFKNFFDSINLDEKLKKYSSKFIIRGASFITINKKEVSDSVFHLDVMSPYDDSTTNILTIIFPLYLIDNLMGNLEYRDKNSNKI